MWASTLFVYSSILLVESSSALIKCCPHGYVFGNNLRCVLSIGSEDDIWNESSFRNKTDFTQSCYRSGEGLNDIYNDTPNFGYNITKVEECVDVDRRNGTIYTRSCPVDWRERFGQCDGIFTPLSFWGGTIVLGSYLIVFPLLLLVVFCIIFPEIRNRVYDKAALCYYVGQLIVPVILVIMGYSVLCHKPITPKWLYMMFGAILQFLIISCIFWINAICFDMTLVITKIRWKHGNDVRGSEEKKKFRMFAAYAWGGAGIITAFTCFMDLCPWIPTSSPLKPHFERFDDGPNYTLLLYVSVVPIITLIINHALFIYTTYKVIKIRKSTAFARENDKDTTKRYYVFLRLYLSMDALSFIGIAAAIYPEIWILKFTRMLQPMLMLVGLIPEKKFRQVITCSKSKVTESNLHTKNKTSAVPC